MASRRCESLRDKLRSVEITYLPHAREQMAERGIPEEDARAALQEPDAEYPGDAGRTVAERLLPGRRLAVKVVYNLGSEGERVVVSVMRGRPKVSPRGRETEQKGSTS